MTPSGAATTRRDGWPLVDGLHRSPALTALGLVAGFTTRADGSLAGSVFPEEDQAGGRDRLARRLGFAGVARVRQVHGDSVVEMSGPLPSPWPAADGMWSRRDGVLLGIAAADCVPLLLADPAGPIGAAHAGWEGTTRGIAGALVRAMRAGGADPSRIVAAIGPSIGPCCYTVDAERCAVIRDRLGEGADGLLDVRGGAATFDLWAANRRQLADAGVLRIEAARLCTRCGGADLWSYRSRGDRGPQGTGLGVIGRPAGAQ